MLDGHGPGTGPERSGSCATVVLIVNDMIYVANETYQNLKYKDLTPEILEELIRLSKD